MAIFPRTLPTSWHMLLSRIARRRFTVLAIETSCDDTSVAILYSPRTGPAQLLAHETKTCSNRKYGGIHPLASVQFHRRNLAPLVASALHQLRGGGGRGGGEEKKPDLVAVTRGPGMLAALATGVDTAKGLCAAWGVPMVGVHHMQAHALTPRLAAALEGREAAGFPFLTLLVSGGHTILLESKALTSHSVLAETIDIALGDMLDKCARRILPEEVVAAQGESVAYGAALERFCFPQREGEVFDYDYKVAKTSARKQQDREKVNKWGDWRLSRPLSKNEKVHRVTDFSFSGLGSTLDRYFEMKPGGPETISVNERRELGRETMMVAFEHVASRIVIALNTILTPPTTLVISGGVGANKFLKHLVGVYLAEHGQAGIDIVVPPQKYCTDNAAMIAWAGLEMYRDGWETESSATPVRKWSLDDKVHYESNEVDGETGDKNGPGGILGISGWKRRM